MINWLAKINTSFNSTMLKPQFYNIMRKHKEVSIKYSLDSMLSKEGRGVIKTTTVSNGFKSHWNDLVTSKTVHCKTKS